MFSDIVRVYQKDSKYLVLNPTVPSWIVTNINGVLVLKCYRNDLSFEEIAKEFLNHCPSFSKYKIIDFLKKVESQGFFAENQQYCYVASTLQSVYLNMTDKCNLNCSYCFASSREEKTSQYLDTDNYFDLLAQMYQINKNIKVTFTGGEPLLSVNTLPVAKKALETGFETFLLSNGTLIDKNNVDNLVSLFKHIRISMDGSTKEIYGRYRGEENFEKVKSAIELLIEKGADVTVAVVVTRENKNDIKNMVDLWGDRLRFMPLFPMGGAVLNKRDNALTGKQYYDVLSEDGRIEPFSDIVNIIQNAGKPHLKCALGDSELSISATGDVYPCQLLHNKDCYLGNVHEYTLEQILKSEETKKFGQHSIYEIEECRDCDVRLICGGACQARHYCENGTIDRAGKFCDYEKTGIINGIFSRTKLVCL